MLLFSQTTCTLSGGRDTPLFPFGTAKLSTLPTNEYDYSAKGSAQAVFAGLPRNVLPGFATVDAHFPNTDHKLAWQKLLIGCQYYGGNVHLDVRAVLKDSSTDFWGIDWNDPFTVETRLTVLGEPMTEAEQQLVVPGLLIDLFQIRQPVNGRWLNGGRDEFRLLNTVWPYEANVPTDLKVDVQLRPEFDPAHSELLQGAGPLLLRFDYYGAQNRHYAQTHEIALESDGRQGHVFTIPAEWCRAVASFTVQLIKSTSSGPLTSSYAGGTLSFI